VLDDLELELDQLLLAAATNSVASDTLASPLVEQLDAVLRAHGFDVTEPGYRSLRAEIARLDAKVLALEASVCTLEAGVRDLLRDADETKALNLM